MLDKFHMMKYVNVSVSHLLDSAEEVKGEIRERLNGRHKKGCAGANWKGCAEGKVSHVLSARLSSRAMDWSEHGCDRMSELRAYKKNGGKIIALLAYQRAGGRRSCRRKK